MIKLLHGDCLELMKDIPDKSIDMILCDLPYGTTACRWDSIIPFEQLWEQYNRVIKDNGAIALFGSEPFASRLRMSCMKYYRYDWVWCKPKGSGFFNAKKMPLKNHETISIFYKTMPTYNPQMTTGRPYKVRQGYVGEYLSQSKSNNPIVTVNNGVRYPVSVLNFKIDTGLHPTQKPVALLEYLIKTYTTEGETVLDNCMGSGSTGIACINTKRNFIGIEKDDKYFEIAKSRIEKAQQDVAPKV
ncbi:MAG TPA: site-specific DNA-methyltransferase [Acetivibrio sp.]|nr:site-specific DNA-methyltransferase [Acetivibrio sp.]